MLGTNFNIELRRNKYITQMKNSKKCANCLCMWREIQNRGDFKATSNNNDLFDWRASVYSTCEVRHLFPNY